MEKLKVDDCACKECPVQLINCPNCDGYEDCDHKMPKHDLFFCEARELCLVCQKTLTDVSLPNHYRAEHKDVIYSSGSTWRAKFGEKYCLLTFSDNFVMCKYTLNKNEFDLYVYIPANIPQLEEYRCMVQLTDPDTGTSSTFTPDTEYIERWDWNINVKKHEFPSWNTKYDVRVEIMQQPKEKEKGRKSKIKTKEVK